MLALGVAAISGASILVRLADAAPLAIAAWRLGLATAVVVPLALARGRLRWTAPRTESTSALAGVLLALHFATWIASLAYTSVAQSVVLVTTAPVWVALFGRALGLIPRGETPWAGIALCVAGSTLVALAPGGGRAPAPDPLRGNALALAGALCMGGYLLAARAAQRRLDFVGFVARAYATAALVLGVAVAATGTAATGFDPRTWFALAGLALVAQLVGHGGTNWSLRHLAPALVAVALVAEPVLASLLAWLVLGEAPTAAVVAGGALVLGGIALSVRRRAA